MYNYITKSIRNTRWAIHNDGGVSENGLGTPWGGVNPNDKTVMINPPGAYMGGVNENFSPEWKIFHDICFLKISFIASS